MAYQSGLSGEAYYLTGLSPVCPARHILDDALAYQSGGSGTASGSIWPVANPVRHDAFLMMVPISPVGHILGRRIGLSVRCVRLTRQAYYSDDWGLSVRFVR